MARPKPEPTKKSLSLELTEEELIHLHMAYVEGRLMAMRRPESFGLRDRKKSQEVFDRLWMHIEKLLKPLRGGEVVKSVLK